jgi:hypothetical protein
MSFSKCPDLAFFFFFLTLHVPSMEKEWVMSSLLPVEETGPCSPTQSHRQVGSPAFPFPSPSDQTSVPPLSA